MIYTVTGPVDRASMDMTQFEGLLIENPSRFYDF